MKKDFIQIACSDDITRINITKPYRDLTRWVGCDGHRLHLKDYYPIEKPFSLAGPDIEYPNYSFVIPTTPPTASTSFTISQSIIKELKTLLKAAKLSTHARDICARIDLLEAQTFTLTIQGDPSKNLYLNIRYSLPCSEWKGTFQPTGIDIRYFTEALISMYDETALSYMEVIFEIHQSPSPSGSTLFGPFVLKHGPLQALIMPMRLSA